MDIINNLECLQGAQRTIIALKDELQTTTHTVNQTNTGMQEFWNDGRYSEDSEMLTNITSSINNSVETLEEYLAEISRLISVIEQY